MLEPKLSIHIGETPSPYPLRGHPERITLSFMHWKDLINYANSCKEAKKSPHVNKAFKRLLKFYFDETLEDDKTHKTDDLKKSLTAIPTPIKPGYQDAFTKKMAALKEKTPLLSTSREHDTENDYDSDMLYGSGGGSGYNPTSKH